MSSDRVPRLAITMGDPAGIGPEIILKALSHPEVYDLCIPTVYGDLEWMQRTAHALRLEQQVVNDWHIIFLRTEERFRKGEVTLESFYSSTRIYNDELNKEVQLTGTIASASAELEELIGMNLEDAIQMYNAQKLNGK